MIKELVCSCGKYRLPWEGNPWGCDRYRNSICPKCKTMVQLVEEKKENSEIKGLTKRVEELEEKVKDLSMQKPSLPSIKARFPYGLPSWIGEPPIPWPPVR